MNRICIFMCKWSSLCNFYVKCDCMLFSVNMKLFFEFFVMRERLITHAWNCFRKRYRGPSLLSCGSLAGRKFVKQLLPVLAFSGFWYLISCCLKLYIGHWTNFVTVSEQTAIKAIFTMFTLEFKTFDVVLNAWILWIQKKWHAQNMTVF